MHCGAEVTESSTNKQHHHHQDPGRLRLSHGASLKPDESEGCSPVSGGRTIRLCSFWPWTMGVHTLFVDGVLIGKDLGVLVEDSVCFFVLCNRHWFNKAPGPDPRGTELGVTYVPSALSSDAGYADLPLVIACPYLRDFAKRNC